MTEPSEQPWVPPYELNRSSGVLNGEELWPQSDAPPPGAPRPPRSPVSGARRWLRLGIVVAIVAALCGLGALASAEYQAIASRSAQAVNDDPAVPGVPAAPSGSDRVPTESPKPVAVVCPPTCFSVKVAGLLVPNNSLQMSMPVGEPTISPDFQHPGTAAGEYSNDSRLWALLHEPDVCFFIYPLSPVGSLYRDPDSTNQDPVTFLGETSDSSEQTTLTLNARFFPTSAAATDYMGTVREQQPYCQTEDHSVVATPSFTVDDGMDINAFTQLRQGERIYDYDIRRANMVVRFQVVSDDEVDEPAVVHFIHTWTTTTLVPLDPE